MIAGSSRADRQPLDVSLELSRLAEHAEAHGSLQSTLILLKTLLCVVDPATAAVEGYSTRQSPVSQPSIGRGGRSRAHPAAGSEDTSKGLSVAGPASGAVAGSALTVKTAPLLRLLARDLSDWSDVTELLRREKHREMMLALRGRPSLTVCCGKADIRGRLEAKGEAAGVVTAVHVRYSRMWRWRAHDEPNRSSWRSGSRLMSFSLYSMIWPRLLLQPLKVCTANEVGRFAVGGSVKLSSSQCVGL